MDDQNCYSKCQDIPVQYITSALQSLPLFVMPTHPFLFHSRLQAIVLIMAHLDVSVANVGSYLCEFKP